MFFLFYVSFLVPVPLLKKGNRSRCRRPLLHGPLPSRGGGGGGVCHGGRMVPKKYISPSKILPWEPDNFGQPESLATSHTHQQVPRWQVPKLGGRGGGIRDLSGLLGPLGEMRGYQESRAGLSLDSDGLTNSNRITEVAKNEANSAY